MQTIISENGEATLAELERLFPEVSSMTLRRDLEKLEMQGEIVRTRSGAKSIAHLSRLHEDLYSERARENTAEKKQIAQRARRFITQGSSVFLDSGTTVTYLANLLVGDRLFVITSAPNIALSCVKNQYMTVFLTGGRLSGRNLSLSGLNALTFLDCVNIDTAFVGASGYTPDNAFTCGNYDESQMKKRVIEKAARVVLLMDSSKAGKSLPFTFAHPRDIEFLVTDDKIGPAYLEELQKETEVIW